MADPYRNPVTQLEERLDRIEAQLRGDPGQEAIDLRALPLTRLENHLEFDWRPEGVQLLQPKSVGSEEIGELPGTLLDRTGALALAGGAVTVIPWQGAIYDIGGQWNNGTDLVIKTAGKYVITKGAYVEENGAGHYESGVYITPINGSGRYIACGDSMYNAGNEAPLWIASSATIRHLSAGDIVQGYVYSTNALGWNMPLATYNFLAIQWVGT